MRHCGDGDGSGGGAIVHRGSGGMARRAAVKQRLTRRRAAPVLSTVGFEQMPQILRQRSAGNDCYSAKTLELVILKGQLISE